MNSSNRYNSVLNIKICFAHNFIALWTRMYPRILGGKTGKYLHLTVVVSNNKLPKKIGFNPHTKIFVSTLSWWPIQNQIRSHWAQPRNQPSWSPRMRGWCREGNPAEKTGNKTCSRNFCICSPWWEECWWAGGNRSHPPEHYTLQLLQRHHKSWCKKIWQSKMRRYNYHKDSNWWEEESKDESTNTVAVTLSHPGSPDKSLSLK